MSNLGKFITLEGVDGAGKTTHIEFIKNYLSDLNINYVMTREPGGTALGEKLRDILLHDEMNPQTETMLMFAARNEHIDKIIRPNLIKGAVVISDRFTDATYAYQGYGRGYDLEAIATLERLVQQGRQPDLTLLFDIDPRVGIERARQRAELDRFEEEALSFFERVRNGYLQRAAMESRFAVIDAAGSIEDVQATLTETLRPIIEGSM